MITYTEAVEYLLEIPKFSKTKTSLKDLNLFLEALGNPQQGKKVIHVAGTNGKGSVCAFLTSILIEGQKSVGTFTSPHLIDINERFAINRIPVDNESFLAGFTKVHEVSEELNRKGYLCPTFFEFLFLMAMVIFHGKSVEYIVLETGLGGRLDATNVISNPLISIITSISLDHVEILGKTISEIAKEKAGIIKPCIPVVYDGSVHEAAEVIKKAAGEKEARTFPVNPGDYEILLKEKGTLKFCTVSLRGEQQILKIPFIGDYQAMNGMLAVRAIEVIDSCHEFSWDQVKSGLQKTIWPGRMEQILDGVYLDGAHNPGAVKEFIKTAGEIIKESPSHQGKSPAPAFGKKLRSAESSANTGKTYLLFAAVSDKDYKSMAKDICQSLDLEAVILTEIDNNRGLSLDSLERVFSEFIEKKILSFKNVEDAFDTVLHLKTRDDKVFCVGTLYLAGAIKAVLRRKHL